MSRVSGPTFKTPIRYPFLRRAPTMPVVRKVFPESDPVLAIMRNGGISVVFCFRDIL